MNSGHEFCIYGIDTEIKRGEKVRKENLQSNCAVVMEMTLTDSWESDVPGLFVECFILAAF